MRRLAIIFSLWAAVAAATVQVTNVDMQSSAEQGATLRIATSATPSHRVQELQGPHRLIIDVPATSAATPSITPNAWIESVQTSRFDAADGPMVRFVVALRDDVKATVEQDATGLTVRARSHAEAAVVSLTGSDAPASAAQTFRAIKVQHREGGDTIRLDTDGQVERYEVQEAAEPARLIVDLIGVKTKGNREQALDGTPFAKAKVGQHADKTRIVLFARDTVPHVDVANTGDGIMLAFAAKPAAQTTELRGLSFDRKNGFWRLRMDAGRAVTVSTLKQTPTNKQVLLEGVRLTAAQTQQALKEGGVNFALTQTAAGTVVELSMATAAEDAVWQKDGAVVWDVRESMPAPAERVQPVAAPFSSGPITLTQQGTAAAAYRGKRITIDIVNADIVNVIRILGDVSGKNIIVAGGIDGKVTLKLKQVPWDQALDVVLKTQDLGKEERGGVIRIVPQEKLNKERDDRLKAAKDREISLPTTVRLVPVNYAVAGDLAPKVKEVLSKDRGKITFDERTNVVILEDLKENLDQAERLIRTLDTQTQQVLIEARMVEGTTKFTRSLGIQWGGGLLFSQRGGNPTGLVFPNNVGLVGGADDQQQLNGQPQAGVLSPSNWAVNLPAAGNVGSALGLNLGSIGNFGFLNARISAAEATNEAKTVSAPRIMTMNNKQASITQGTDIPFAVVTQNQLTTQVIRAALTLDVTPHVTTDGSIFLDLRITNNVPIGTPVAGSPPPVSTKEAKTQLLVPDGGTAVIGGIYTRSTATEVNQTPFLGSIPLIGWLFKNSVDRDERSEMLVFVTPRIVSRRSMQVGGAQ
jgi:type IV pilus assembly protein PilQ